MKNDQIQFRKVARKLCLRKREYALTSNEQVLARKYRKLITNLLWKVGWADEDSERCESLAKICLSRYYSIIVGPSVKLARPPRMRVTIDSFSTNDCKNFFEFRKEDLPRLLFGLRFPEQCKLADGSVMCDEEVMLRGLYELVSGEDQHNISANVFGREQTAQSRAFKYFIEHIYNTFNDLLYDNLEFWRNGGFLAESNAAITVKLGELGIDIDDIFGFIDCNCLEVERVGGGPRSDGPDADRWVSNIQRAFYNGWKSIHGLKHQTVVIAHGFTIDMYGPTSVRRNDLKLLADSAINARLNRLLGDRLWKLYGDSIYPRMSNLTSSWRCKPQTPRMKMENYCMKSVRISIEWSYGATSNLFHYLRNIEKLKVMRSEHITHVYFVCALLRNCHVALYGGIESNYFDITIPPNMLELFLRVHELHY